MGKEKKIIEKKKGKGGEDDLGMHGSWSLLEGIT